MENELSLWSDWSAPAPAVDSDPPDRLWGTWGGLEAVEPSKVVQAFEAKIADALGDQAPGWQSAWHGLSSETQQYIADALATRRITPTPNSGVYREFKHFLTAIMEQGPDAMVNVIEHHFGKPIAIWDKLNQVWV